jgi:transcriptional regulator with XRE-family HTH domain
VPLQDSPADRGARRSRFLRARLSAELEAARIAGGLSFRELGRRCGLDREYVARAVRGDLAALTVDAAARLAAVLGLQLSAGLHPDGDPVRDRAHLALLERMRARLGALVTWRFEVAIPIAGDRRSADAVIEGAFGEGLVEAETRMDDIQGLERKVAAKARDLGLTLVILLVADTRHNRAVIAMHPELKATFSVGTRACLGAIASGKAPAGNCLVVL